MHSLLSVKLLMCATVRSAGIMPTRTPGVNDKAGRSKRRAPSTHGDHPETVPGQTLDSHLFPQYSQSLWVRWQILWLFLGECLNFTVFLYRVLKFTLVGSYYLQIHDSFKISCLTLLTGIYRNTSPGANLPWTPQVALCGSLPTKTVAVMWCYGLSVS